MVDQLGWRCKFGVIVPSTNTVVQPEYDDMRPVGVTNHIARMHIPDDPIKSDAELEELVRRIDSALEEALDRVMTARPDHVILGVSAESFWGGGLEPSRRIAARVKARAGGISLTQAAEAIPAALKAYGIKERIAVVTPYRPSAEPYLRAVRRGDRLPARGCSASLLREPDPHRPRERGGTARRLPRARRRRKRRRSSSSARTCPRPASPPRPSAGSESPSSPSTRRPIGTHCASAASPTASPGSGGCWRNFKFGA